MLRRYGGRTSEVARAMMDLFETVSDPLQRAEILRHIQGVEDPEVARGLIEALLSDTDATVREHAATALATFARNDDVRHALDKAARSDASEAVRLTAQDTLVSTAPDGD